MAATKRNYADMSLDDLLDDGLDDSSGSDDENPSMKRNKQKKLKTKLKKSKVTVEPVTKEKKSKKKGKKTLEQENMETKPSENAEPNTKNLSRAKSHKKSMDSLKEKDPEFFKFLQKEDQNLLEFGASDGSESGDDEDGSDGESDGQSSDEEAGGKFHKIPNKLKVDSDDSEASDAEAGEKAKSKSNKTTIRVTQKLVSEWETALMDHVSLKTLRPIIQAFKAAVHTSEDEDSGSRYKVDDSTVFNAVVRLSLTKVLTAFTRILNLPMNDKLGKKMLNPTSSKHWKRVSVFVKSYLVDVLKLLANVKEGAIVNVVLRHIYQLVPYYLVFPKVCKSCFKSLILTWSEGEEASRVLAFLSLIKIVRSRQDKMLEPCMKKMYMAYVKNCKFTSPTTLPLINFMQRSLVEVLALDSQASYQYAFVYIRQLAIHLRNAMTVKKKESCQAVYNWQYIHSLALWSRLVSQLHDDDTIAALIYPLTQIIIGTIKLVPSPRYYPLRFHCVRLLNTISISTNTYIPVMPFLLEVFELTDFNKRPRSVSFKPFNFSCILKLSKQQLSEKAFREGVMDQLFELMLDQFHVHSHCIGFPELALPAVIQIKDFLKKCKVANFTKQMKQVLDRVKEASNCITERRKRSNIELKDLKAVDLWESRSKEEGTPLSRYYTTWRKGRDRELIMGVASRDQVIGDDDRLPELTRPRPMTLIGQPAAGMTSSRVPQASHEDKEEFAALFDQSDDDEDDNTRFMLKEERPKKEKAKKKSGSADDSDSDDYSDFNEEELEQLAGSADDDSDSDNESGNENDSDDADVDGNEDNDENDDDDDDDDEKIPDEEDVVEDFKFSDEEG